MTDDLITCEECDNDHLYRRELSRYMTAELDTQADTTLELEVSDLRDGSDKILFYPRETAALAEFLRDHGV